jgi:hypothetical protein
MSGFAFELSIKKKFVQNPEKFLAIYKLVADRLVYKNEIYNLSYEELSTLVWSYSLLKE